MYEGQVSRVSLIELQISLRTSRTLPRAYNIHISLPKESQLTGKWQWLANITATDPTMGQHNFVQLV